MPSAALVSWTVQELNWFQGKESVATVISAASKYVIRYVIHAMTRAVMKSVTLALTSAVTRLFHARLAGRHKSTAAIVIITIAAAETRTAGSVMRTTVIAAT